MKQKQISSNYNQEKMQLSLNKISFKQTIMKIELNSYQQEFQRKKQISIKSKLKQLWLQRIKIIPPYFKAEERETFFRVTNSFTDKENDNFKMFRHNHFKKEFDDDTESLFQKRLCHLSSHKNQVSEQSKLQRRSHNPSRMGKVQSLRGLKLKQNWKLAYRRDELNVLRFSNTNSKEGNLLKSGDIRQFKQRIEEVKQRKPQMSEMICTKINDFEEEQNKQNIGDRKEQMREGNKFRVNVKKVKTSLIIIKDFFE